jgi:hypothetical protein
MVFMLIGTECVIIPQYRYFSKNNGCKRKFEEKNKENT